MVLKRCYLRALLCVFVMSLACGHVCGARVAASTGESTMFATFKNKMKAFAYKLKVIGPNFAQLGSIMGILREDVSKKPLFNNVVVTNKLTVGTPNV